MQLEEHIATMWRRMDGWCGGKTKRWSVSTEYSACWSLDAGDRYQYNNTLILRFQDVRLTCFVCRVVGCLRKIGSRMHCEICELNRESLAFPLYHLSTWWSPLFLFSLFSFLFSHSYSYSPSLFLSLLQILCFTVRAHLPRARSFNLYFPSKNCLSHRAILNVPSHTLGFPHPYSVVLIKMRLLTPCITRGQTFARYSFKPHFQVLHPFPKKIAIVISRYQTYPRALHFVCNCSSGVICLFLSWNMTPCLRCFSVTPCLSSTVCSNIPFLHLTT